MKGVIALLLIAALESGVNGDGCVGRTLVTAPAGNITDGYDVYPTVWHCIWTIQAPRPTDVVTLYVDLVDTECGWDFFYVYDGSDFPGDNDAATDNLLGAFSGQVTLSGMRIPPLLSTKPSMVLHFYSDQALQFQGFNVHYTTGRCPMSCSGRGVCNDATGTCACNSGFEGLGCENVCPACQHGGVCRGGRCVCPPGFAGPECSMGPTDTWRLAYQPVLGSADERLYRRSGAAMVFAPGVGPQGSLLVFGGYDYAAGYRSDALRWDRATSAWSTLPKMPIGAASLSAAIINDGVYVFGGQTSQTTFSGRFMKLNTTTWVWSNITAVNPPMGRAFHGTTVLNGRMYLYGGYTELPAGGYVGMLRDFWRYNPRNNVWTQIVSKNADPGELLGVTLSTLGTDLLLFGGSRYDAEMTNDVWVYSVAANRWRRQGSDIPPRYMQSGVPFGKSTIVFGGRTDINAPGQGSCYGGDAWALDASCETMRVLAGGGEGVGGPARRYGAAAAVAGAELYVFGGFDSIVLGDLWALQLDPCLASLTPGNVCMGSAACSPSCGRGSGCGECAALPGCGWCPDEATCVAGNATVAAPGECPALTYVSGVCPTPCESLAGCTDCLAAPECVWCDAGICVPRGTDDLGDGACGEGIVSATTCTQQCSTYRACGSCIAGGCGWCRGNVQCQDIGSRCPNGQNANFLCDSECSAQPNCQACVALQCMWDIAGGSCFDANIYKQLYPYGTLWEYEFGACRPDCNVYNNCGDCQRDPRCGWCASDNTCRAGSVRGPDGATCALWDWTECPCQANSCGNCLMDARCGWCVESATCMRNSSINAVSCSTLDFGACSSCGTHLSCSSCTADSLCGWCGVTDQCLRTGQGSSTQCPIVGGLLFTASRPCNHCSALSTCATCTANPLCGQCFGGPCVAGGPSGPFNFSRGGAPCIFDYAQCRPHCETYTQCGACTAAASCGWCCGTGGAPMCSEQTACPALWSHTCPDCSQKTSCQTCADGGCCGWCDTEGTCQAVNYLGQANCTMADWYIEQPTCPAPCSVSTTCASCALQRHCGWCATSNTCLDTAARTACPSRWVPHGMGCPERCAGVSALAGCVSCLALPGCGWCANVTNAASRCVHSVYQETCPSPVTLWINTTCPTNCTTRTACASCTNAADCQWCDEPPASGHCVSSWVAGLVSASCAGRNTSLVSAPAMCPLCRAATCSQCSLSAGCFWCGSSATCMAVVDGAQCLAPFFGCNGRCSTYTACGNCTADPACGWCGATNLCVPARQATGQPLYSACPAEMWDYGSCAHRCATLGQSNGCSGCVATDPRECGFCLARFGLPSSAPRGCLPGGPAGPIGVACDGQWDYSNCSLPCSAFTSCGACVGTGRCGFCSLSGTCQEGAQSGPGVSSPMCNASNWNWGSCDGYCRTLERCIGSICPTEGDCSMCAGADDCGYCSLTGECHGVGYSQCTDYAINAANCPVLTRLELSQAFVDSVTDRNPKLYKVYVPSTAQAVTVLLTVAVTSVSRTPAMLYASYLTTTPGVLNYQFRAAGADGVTNLTVSAATEARFRTGVFLYIAAVPTTNASVSYSVLASAREATPGGGGSEEGWSSVSFWVVYFIGVFFGTLLGIILVALIFKKVRDNMAMRRRNRAAQRAMVLRASMPLVPMIYALVTEDDEPEGGEDAAEPVQAPARTVSKLASALGVSEAAGGAGPAAEEPEEDWERQAPTPYFLCQFPGRAEPEVFVAVSFPPDPSQPRWASTAMASVSLDDHGRGAAIPLTPLQMVAAFASQRNAERDERGDVWEDSTDEFASMDHERLEKRDRLWAPPRRDDDGSRSGNAFKTASRGTTLASSIDEWSSDDPAAASVPLRPAPSPSKVVPPRRVQSAVPPPAPAARVASKAHGASVPLLALRPPAREGRSWTRTDSSDDSFVSIQSHPQLRDDGSRTDDTRRQQGGGRRASFSRSSAEVESGLARQPARSAADLL